MRSIFAVANQKGGVGKTTTAVNLAASLAFLGRNVLLVDCDPQGNATMGCGIDKQSTEKSCYDVLMEKVSLSDALCSVDAGFDVLPANTDLTAAEIELIGTKGKEARLAQAIEAVRSKYDCILIDCLPSLNILTVNALCAADGVIIPMQCEYFALEGLTDLIDTVAGIRARLNPKLAVAAIVRTLFDGRSRLSTDVSLQLTAYFGDTVMATVIPRNIRLAEAPSFGAPVLQYDKNAKGTLAYLALADEFLQKVLK